VAVSNPPARIDLPTCREDLVRKAAASDAWYDFGWITDKEARRVTNDPRNRGLTATEIKEMTLKWILDGKPIRCVPETREGYRDRRHFHYDIIIQPLDDFPRGLYVEMELSSTNEDCPSVNLLNAHPPSL
jgi:hypothetical protein